MDIFSRIKQLKSIEPDPSYTAISKRAILAVDAAPSPLRGAHAVRAVFFRVIETASAVALTGFFVLLLSGAFSGTGLSPEYSAVNPEALRAEAQAIDIQIQLSKLAYAVPPGMPASTLIQAATTTPSGAITTTISITPAATSSATGTENPPVTIDQALQGLTQ